MNTVLAVLDHARASAVVPSGSPVLGGTIEISTGEILLLLAVFVGLVLVAVAAGAVPVALAVRSRTRRVWPAVAVGLPAGVVTAVAAMFVTDAVASEAWILPYGLNWAASVAVIADARRRRRLATVPDPQDGPPRSPRSP